MIRLARSASLLSVASCATPASDAIARSRIDCAERLARGLGGLRSTPAGSSRSAVTLEHLRALGDRVPTDLLNSRSRRCPQDPHTLTPARPSSARRATNSLTRSVPGYSIACGSVGGEGPLTRGRSGSRRPRATRSASTGPSTIVGTGDGAGGTNSGTATADAGSARSTASPRPASIRRPRRRNRRFSNRRRSSRIRSACPRIRGFSSARSAPPAPGCRSWNVPRRAPTPGPRLVRSRCTPTRRRAVSRSIAACSRRRSAAGRCGGRSCRRTSTR